MKHARTAAFAAGLAAAVCATTNPLRGGVVPDAPFVAGDTLLGSMDAEDDVDAAVFQGLRGMKLRMTVTTGPDKTPSTPKIEVRDGWYKTVGRSVRTRVGRPVTFALRSSGTHAVRVLAAGMPPGGYSIATSATLPRTARGRKAKLRAKQDLEAKAGVDLLTGATVDLRLVPPPSAETPGLFAVDPDGRRIDLDAWTAAEDGALVVDDFLAAATGTWQFGMDGFAAKGERATLQITPTQPVGDGTVRLDECVLPPDFQPVVESLTYTLDAALDIDASAGALGIQTIAGSATFTAGSATVNGVRPDVTQVAFLTGDGTPFAPLVVRSADAAAPPVVIDVDRVARGVVALHPWVARLDDAQRENFFSRVDDAASWPFLVTAVRQALAETPLSLADASIYPEVFRAGDKTARETLLLLDGIATAKALFPSPWGDLEEPPTFAVYGTDTAHALLVNPRWVFYGVGEDGPGAFARMHLVPPRGSLLTAPPGTEPDPWVGAVDVLPGRTTFRARALSDEVGLDTPERLGTTANALCAVLHVMDLATPLPQSPVQTTSALLGRWRSQGMTQADETLLAGLGVIAQSGTPEVLAAALQQFLTSNGAAHWRTLAWAFWNWNPQTVSGGVLVGTSRFLYGYFTVADVAESLPFLVDLYRAGGEQTLVFNVNRRGNDVTVTSDEPFACIPDFTVAPTFPSVGEETTFDPAPTAFVGEPPVAPTYRWTIWDDPGDPPTVIDRGTSTTPVTATFTVPGFHLVMLEVTIGDVVATTFRTVQVESLRNMGFELGTMDEWIVETHTWFDPTPGSQPSHSAIMEQGFDPIAPGLPTVFHGAYSLRIEDENWGGYISSATRTIQVPAGMVLKFAWAAVLEDPQHQPNEQPYFDIKVRDETTQEDLYAIHHYSNEPGFPWNDAQGGSWKWVPWQPVTLDLTARAGHTVTISAIAADCEPTGHGGYVYFDAP